MMHRTRYLTAGESHGKGLLGIIEGIPAGLEIDEDCIARQLARRQMGYGRSRRMKIELDRAEIYCGVRHGKTLGSPIGLIIPNKDWSNWKQEMAVEPTVEAVKKVTLPRPGHSDLAGVMKYDFEDIRNVLERASARETAMQVALSAICRRLLKEAGIEVGSRVIQIHTVKDGSPIPEGISPEELNDIADSSEVRCLDRKAEATMIAAIKNAQNAGDSVGGVFEVIAAGLPYGLGSHTHWDRKLQSRIAGSLMSINALKGVEIGLGFPAAGKSGSEVHDEIFFNGKTFQRQSNSAGGIEGGMSNAQPVVVRAVMKPIPTLVKPLKSVDIKTKEAGLAHKERTDACAVPAASVVAEGALCFVLADALVEKFGGDTVGQLKIHMAKTARY